MTVLKFKKKLVCGKNCHKNFTAKVVALCPSFETGVNGHITILLTFYDSKKGHENWTSHGIQYTKFNEIQKIWKGNVPTKSEVENL